MERWGFIKRFSPISFGEFTRFAEQFCRSVDACYKSPSITTVTFYKLLPLYTTFYGYEPPEWVGERNRTRELAKVIGLENVTKELFDQAVKIELDIRPTDKNEVPQHAFGSLEYGGESKQRLIFCVRPDEMANRVKQSYAGKNRPSKLFWSVVTVLNV